MNKQKGIGIRLNPQQNSNTHKNQENLSINRASLTAFSDTTIN